MIRPTCRVRSTRSCSVRVLASICSPRSLTARTACAIDSSPSRELVALEAATSSTACALLCALANRSRKASTVRSVSAALAACARECSSWRVAPSNTSSEVVSRATAASRISATTARVLLRSSRRARASRPTSSSPSSRRTAARSPAASSSAKRTIRRSLRESMRKKAANVATRTTPLAATIANVCRATAAESWSVRMPITSVPSAVAFSPGKPMPLSWPELTRRVKRLVPSSERDDSRCRSWLDSSRSAAPREMKATSLPLPSTAPR